MWELLWFFLGVLSYKILSSVLQISRKAQFIKDIKVIAFVLIGRALEELTKINALKYAILQQEPTITTEKIKIYKNEDEVFLSNWQRKTIQRLNYSVPPLYYAYIKVDDWEDITKLLISSYDRTIQRVEKSFDTE